MLLQLHIENFAIIRQLDIEFSRGLQIITGETGAGKSILMGALGLVLGDRADSQVLRDAQKKCIVEAVFSMPDDARLQSFFDENDLDAEGQIRIRREINPAGKSRTFINDTPVTLQPLRQLATSLADLHRQFDTMELASSAFQREALDAFSGQLPDARVYAFTWKQYSAYRQQLASLQKEVEQAAREADFNQFLFDEIQQLDLQEGEAEQLESTLKRLEHADQLKMQLSQVYNRLLSADQPMVQELKSMYQRLRTLESYLPELQPILERLQSVQTELDDLAQDMERLADQQEADPGKQEKIQARLSQAFTLFRKHHVQNTEGLLEVYRNLQQKLHQQADLSVQLQEAEKKVQESGEACMKLAQKMSKARQKNAGALEKAVQDLLKEVGMPNARFTLRLTACELYAGGLETVDFLFDANNTGKPEILDAVASGGELSRLMLCIKSLVAGSMELPTLIFDEIDTGISGEAARQVGQIMHRLSEKHQIIAITHLPQIAARATVHYHVSKKPDSSGVLETVMDVLPAEDRIVAIARMLSGEKPTEAALRNARELVGN